MTLHKKTVCLLLFIAIYFSPVLQIQAETKTTNVTASVPNTTAPSIPLLVSPSNNAFLTVPKPSFIWSAATSSATLSHYALYVDDVLFYDNIPTTNTNTSLFTLVFNASTNQYTLTPKNSIPDGSHSWKVRVFDVNSLSSQSASWVFHLDSLAPLFIIEAIDSLTTHISSLNTDSVPQNVLEISNNEPVIAGSGEPGSQVTVTITVEGQNPFQIIFTVDENGTWSFQLPTIPREKITTLTFVIVDQAGNTSTIGNVKIYITREVIEFPSENLQTQIAPLVPLPKISIPFIDPVENLKARTTTVVSSIPKRIVDSIKKITSLARQAIIVPLQYVAPSAAFVATAALPALSIFSLLLQLGPRLFYQAFLRFLQTMGLLPHPDPQGLVFDSKSNQPVAFAIVNITQLAVGQDTVPIKETVVTNTDGLYQGLNLPDGTYSIEIKHQDYSFPSDTIRPSYLSYKDYYRGEQFVVKNNTLPIFLIPVDYSDEENSNEAKSVHFLSIMATRFSFNKLRVPLFLLSLSITLFYPSFINILVVFAYLIIFGRDYHHSLRSPDIYGIVTDENRTPIVLATIRLYEKNTARLISIVQSDAEGYFSVFAEPSTYLINVMKKGYIWDESAAQSYNEIIVSDQSTKCNIVMRRLQS